MVRCGTARSTSSTQSAISFSLRETDSMSTSARVSATGSASTSGVSGFSMSARYRQAAAGRAPSQPGSDREVTRDDSQPAWGIGLATVTADGQVLDTWYPAGKLGLGELRGRRRRRHARPAGRRARRPVAARAAYGRGGHRDRLAGRPDQGHRRRVPAAAPALAPPGPAERAQPRRHLRQAGRTWPGPRPGRARRSGSTSCG